MQAQDRLFQMDLARRQASGRLSRLLGKPRSEQISTSVHSVYGQPQRLPMMDTVKKLRMSLAGMRKASMLLLKRQSGMANYHMSSRFLDTRLNLGRDDSLTIGKYMAYDLGGNWDSLAVQPLGAE